MRPFYTVVVALAVVCAGCETRADVGPATRELLETDRAWARLVEANGPVDSIVDYWTSDARVVLTGQPVVVGSEAIRTMITEAQKIPGFQISWTPDSAVVSPHGDFGYTYGTNRVTAPDSAGVLRTAHGRYITVWRKEPDGRWRCTFDISNEGPPLADAAPPAQ